MNVGLVVGGVIVLFLGLFFFVDGVVIMNASETDSFLGVSYTDEEMYSTGFNEMVMGIVIAIIGLVLLVAGVAVGGKPQQQAPMAPQPYVQQPAYQQSQYQVPLVPVQPPMQHPPMQVPDKKEGYDKHS